MADVVSIAKHLKTGTTIASVAVALGIAIIFIGCYTGDIAFARFGGGVMIAGSIPIITLGLSMYFFGIHRIISALLQLQQDRAILQEVVVHQESLPLQQWTEVITDNLDDDGITVA